MALRHEIERLAHDYVRKGGKQNRRKQAKRMIALAVEAEKMGCKHIGELGKRHVIGYFKANRDLSDAVIYQHWLAFCQLWVLAKKTGEPPKPFFSDQRRSRKEPYQADGHQ